MDGHRERLIPPLPAATPRVARKQSRVLAFVRGLFGLVFAMVVVLVGIGGIVGYSLYAKYTQDLPTMEGLRTYQPETMSRVYAGDDRLMDELATERRIFVPVTAIPDRVKQAFIAAEDQHFYTNQGIDLAAIARAAATDLQHLGEKRRPVGASTITQQLVRNMLGMTSSVSLERKVRELLLARRIDHALGKERILELYLNEIYLGQGSYGVVAAAQTYFNKPLDQLSIGEAAMLAALPKSPSNYNPFHFPDAARIRRDWVIDRMVETHAITASEAAAAHAEPLVPAPYRKPEGVAGAEWFDGEVRRQLIERFGQDAASEGGLIVHTSLDPALQEMADRALRAGLMHYDRTHGGWRGPAGQIGNFVSLSGDWQDALAKTARPPGMLPDWRFGVVLDETSVQARVGFAVPAEGSGGSVSYATGAIALSDLGWARPVDTSGNLGPAPRRMADVLKRGDLVMVEPAVEQGHARLERLLLRQVPKVEGALVSLDPRTGRVLAMSGGWSADTSKFNRATQAQRQPGSSFKPFVYLTAMEQGISPSARFSDGPFSLGDWHPNDYEMTYGGPTPLRVALEQSLNLVTIRVAQKIGMNAVAKTAIDFHLVDAMPRVLPAALGAVETTVLREAGAYASLEEGGRVVQPSVIDSVQDRDGHVTWRPPNLVAGAGDPSQPPALSDVRPQAADPASAFQVLKMMEGVVRYGTGVPVGAGIDRPLAGKTGTSQDFNDGWFAGFTPSLVTVVWMGFDTPQTLGDKQDGAHTAGPIWHDFMVQALAGRPKLDFRVPEGVSLHAWGCGRHECVDAFKPGQEPGADTGGGGGGEVADKTDDGVQLLDADPDAPKPPPKQTAGTGVDSGVGGLY